MKKRAFCLIFLMASISSFMTEAASKTPESLMCDGRPKISLDQIEGMFSQIRGNTDWDITGPLLWGYFFTDADKEPLEKLNTILVGENYQHVGIHFDEVWWLHVEKVEAHSVSSLNERNLEFYKLAAENDVDCYDGMDVGPRP